MRDFIVVGGGVGGVLTAGVLSRRGYKTLLLEKDSNLGGSSGSFQRGEYIYNIGATTFAGYYKNTPLKNILDELNIELPIEKVEPALRVIQDCKETDRFRDLDRFIDEVNRDYPNKKNREFWTLVKTISEEFYSYQNYFYSHKNYLQRTLSILSFSDIFFRYYRYIFQNGEKFLQKFLENIDKSYLEFIDNQVLIVAQKRSRDVNALVMLLSLGYTFMPNYYVKGGFGKIFSQILYSINEVKFRSEVVSIEKIDRYFEVKTKSGEAYITKNVVLNSLVFNSSKLFSDIKIQNYYNSFSSLNSFQSAFTLYGVLKSDIKLRHHYQIILEKSLDGTISNSIFISFSDSSDRESAPEGDRTFTISTHIDIRDWEGLSRREFLKKRDRLEIEILEATLKHLQLNRENIIKTFSANSKTFEKYINRDQLGGIPMSEMFYRLPSNITPFKGLYHVGDTIFPAQGWLGVATGVQNLLKSL